MERRMTEDFIVEPRSTKKIEQIALAWRSTLGAPNEWAPNMIDLIENRIPPLFRTFALVVREDSDLGEAEAFTEFSPPQIVVQNTVYLKAARGDGRSRMTLAHELGHLVMHAGIQSNARMIVGNKPAPTSKLYRSAEWQARKFASLFLMPTHVVKEFTSHRQLAECCLVSQQAALIRWSEVNPAIIKRIPDCVAEAVEKLS
jgi:Zn-dependent peptidase ImmA (M78 family)